MDNQKTRLQPDTVMKEYWNRNEEFADLFNAVLYGGERRMRPEDLEERDTELSGVLEIGDSVQTEQSARDVFKIVKRAGNVEYALLGLENQEGIHYAMPLRALNYDVYSYNRQYAVFKDKYNKTKELRGNEYLSRIKKTDRFLPVVTLVIYYGDEPWDGPFCLYDMLDISEELKPFVSDYKLNIIEARDSCLTLRNENNINLFSLLRIIYDTTLSKKERREAAQRYDEEHQVDASVVMAVAATSKITLKDFKERGAIGMCSLFDEIREEGKAEEIIVLYQEMGKNQDEIIDKLQERLNISLDKAQEYYVAFNK
jgi:hypothetical protein